MLRCLGFGMGTVGTILITLNAVGIDTQANMDWTLLLAAIAVGTGFAPTIVRT